MPIVRLHFAHGRYRDEQVRRLLVAVSHAYADVLDAPLDRVRAFAHSHPAEFCVVAGQPVSEGADDAPFFEAIVLAGRRVEHRLELLSRFTDLVVEHLAVDRGLVRGRVIETEPENWAIGGAPASDVRRTEIDARTVTR